MSFALLFRVIVLKEGAEESKDMEEEEAKERNAPYNRKEHSGVFVRELLLCGVIWHSYFGFC